MATATPNVYTLSLHDALPISQVRHKARVGRVIREGMFARRALRPISDSIGRNPQQPGHERNSAPFKTSQIRERFVEHFRSQIFGGSAVAHTAGDEAVHALEM